MKKKNPMSDTSTLIYSLNGTGPKEMKNDIKKNQIGYGYIENIWNVNDTKILKYQQEIWHDGLKEHKIITAPDKNILDNKVRVQVDKWVEK